MQQDSKGRVGNSKPWPTRGGPTEDTDETEHGIDRETLRRRVHGGDVRYNQISRPENGPIYRAEFVKSFMRQPADPREPYRPKQAQLSPTDPSKPNKTKQAQQTQASPKSSSCGSKLAQASSQLQL